MEKMSDFYQENELWQALRAETDSTKQNYQLVQMAKLLLECADLNPVAELDVDDITDLLLEYQEAAELTNDFFNKALPHIDPEYKGQPFEQQLQTLQQTLATTIKEIGRISEQNKILLKQKRQLESEIKQLNKVKSEMETLEQNIADLQLALKPLKQYQARLKELETESEPLHQEAITIVNESIRKILVLIEANKESLDNHFVENVRVGKAIGNNIDKIIQLSKSIGASLQEFDGELRRLI